MRLAMEELMRQPGCAWAQHPHCLLNRRPQLVFICHLICACFGCPSKMTHCIASTLPLTFPTAALSAAANLMALLWLCRSLLQALLDHAHGSYSQVLKCCFTL